MELYVEDGKGGVSLYDPATVGSYWYVMQTPRNKALRVKTFFEENGVEAIVPLHYQDVVRRGKTTSELVSALEDFIYIKADLEKMRWIKKHLPYLTYVREEKFDGRRKKYRVYLDNEVVDFFRLLEANFLDDFLIVDSEDVSNDIYTQINTDGGMFENIPLFFENVKGVDHKCLTMILDNWTVIAVKSITPETFMSQECEMCQIINGKLQKTRYPLVEVAS
ncbi:MAG: transcription termination/antitermination NusG family protein [Rikenellaceae bacterium]